MLWRLLILLALIGLVGLTISLAQDRTGPGTEVIVTLTKDGFSPDYLTIKPGTTVTFTTNVEGKFFWPAADSHPTHDSLPELDPKQPIQPDDSWSFVFNNSGTWEMHDHMRALDKMTIEVVEGSENLDCTHSSNRITCWEREFEKTFTSNGIDALHQLVTELNSTNSEFATRCHTLMHSIGEMAYESDNPIEFFTDPVVFECNYGFFHGFIEAVYLHDGSYRNAQQYCEKLSASDGPLADNYTIRVKWECPHGIGHAVFDSIDYTLWGDAKNMTEQALATCEELFADEFGRADCAGGVFNAVEIAKTRQYYKLTLETGEDADPFSHCRELTQAYNYRQQCIAYIVYPYARISGQSIEEILDLVAETEPAIIEELIVNLTSRYIQLESPELSDQLKVANKCFVGLAPAMTDACLKGIHRGVSKKFSLEEQPVISEQICMQLEDTAQQQRCLKWIPIEFWDVYRDRV